MARFGHARNSHNWTWPDLSRPVPFGVERSLDRLWRRHGKPLLLKLSDDLSIALFLRHVWRASLRPKLCGCLQDGQPARGKRSVPVFRRSRRKVVGAQPRRNSNLHVIQLGAIQDHQSSTAIPDDSSKKASPVDWHFRCQRAFGTTPHLQGLKENRPLGQLTNLIASTGPQRIKDIFFRCATGRHVCIQHALIIQPNIPQRRNVIEYLKSAIEIAYPQFVVTEVQVPREHIVAQDSTALLPSTGLELYVKCERRQTVTVCNRQVRPVKEELWLSISTPAVFRD